MAEPVDAGDLKSLEGHPSCGFESRSRHVSYSTGASPRCPHEGALEVFVFVLHHEKDPDSDDDDAKLLGVFSSRERAEEAKARTLQLPGFRDFPEGFTIDHYEVDRLYWDSGFVLM